MDVYCKHTYKPSKQESVPQRKKYFNNGGGTGIGFAIAKKAAEEGARVVITGRHFDKLKSAIESMKSDQIYPLQMDISSVHELNSKIAEAERLLDGEINILVNNAGTYAKTHFPNVTEQDWDNVYDTNSKGTFFMTEEMCKKWDDNTLETTKKLSISLPKVHL